MKKCLLLLAGILFLQPALNAQQVMPLYKGEIPNSIPAADEEETTRKDGIELISKISKPTLTIYRPARANGAAVIICPGGGYWVVAAGHEGRDVAQAFNRLGVTAFVLKYRIPDSAYMKDPPIGPLQDAQQAIKMVRTHAKEWKIDPARVGILGFSAGGHLAASAGTRFAEPFIPNETNISLRPDFMMLIYPVISFTAGFSHPGSAVKLLGKNASLQQLQQFSNELQAGPQTPPAFMVHASDDTGVPPENSILFYETLKKFHIPAELHLYQQGGHGFGLHIKNSADKWMERCANWMKLNGWLDKTVEKKNLYTKGRFLYSPGGEKVVLRGVNKMNVVSDKKGEKSFPEIAKTGANCVRIMWMKFGGGGPALDTILGNSIRHGMIPVIELHDATGKWKNLQDCLAYWTRPDVVRVIKKYQRYLILNIANEAGDYTVTQEDFRQVYADIVKKIRKAGIHVPLMIDAANWGRNEKYLLENGEYLIKNDPDQNLLFSWHIWDSGIAESRIKNTVDRSIALKIPLVIGEFAPMEVKCKCCIPYRYIMQYAQQQQIGWMAWSWGPGNSDCPAMDMTSSDAFDSLHGWGLEVAVEDPYSIRNTSRKPGFMFGAAVQ